MIPLIYRDYGLRYMGDCDFLVRYEDVERLKSVLLEAGFKCGHYNEKTNTIDNLSRAQVIKWNMFSSNLPPFYKLIDNINFPTYQVDFRFALSDELDIRPIKEIMDYYAVHGNVEPYHYLIHLCTHYYDEAKHTISIEYAKDLNLIKLCDIREFIIFSGKNLDFNELLRFAQKYDLVRQVYFTFYHIQLIYGEKYQFMDNINIDTYNFLDEYADTTVGKAMKYPNMFFDRLFNCNNRQYFVNDPSFFSI